MKPTYAEMLKDPRWQRKRLEILERDGWACQSCRTATETLNVHHKVYNRGRQPWEYEDSLLTTYCETCHERVELVSKYLILAAHSLCRDKLDSMFRVGELLMAVSVDVDLGAEARRGLRESLVTDRDLDLFQKAIGRLLTPASFVAERA